MMINLNNKTKITSEYIIAKRIVSENDCENSDMILQKTPRQPVLFTESPCLMIKKGGWIILDFGKELQGGITVTLNGMETNGKMRIVFGESVSEAMSCVGEKNATNDHSIRDVVLPITSWQTFRYGNTGFRFVKIEAVDADMAVAGIQAVFEYRDIEYVGEFECNDEQLNEIWKTGAYTVHLNMQEYLWDGIKRDRLVWVGDMHPEISTILSVFGDNEVIRNSLDFISKYTPANKWMNNTPSYNFWWLKIMLDYYMYSGDIEYINAQKTYICDMLKNILTHVNEDGTHTIDFMFVEWNSNETEYERAGFQAMLAIGLISGAKLCGILRESELENVCLEKSNKVKKHIYPYEGNKQTTAMLTMADMVSADKSSDVIKKGFCEGLSTFWGFYTLQALEKSGDTEAAIDIIREYWGGMLKLGATTFWEDFDVEWAKNAGRIDELPKKEKDDIHGDFGKFCYKGFRHSLCHGWASGPTAFLSRYVLGVEILEPGYKKIRIKPQLGCLEYAKGKIPTPFGVISVKHTSDGNGVQTEISVPDGIEVID